MEINDQSLQVVAEFLEKTLSPDPNVRRPTEKQLETFSTTANYGLILLMLCNKQELALHLRVSASINFKNFIKKNWRIDEDEVNKIRDEERGKIKANIVELMLTSPDQIQRQLSDAVSIISKEDFPDKWQNLLPDMVEKLKKGDFHIINGVLRTAHSIFKRYRHEFQSNTLWKEIKYVLGVFATPLTELFKTLMDMIGQYSADQNAITIIFNSLVLICKIFRSLNAQDLPAEFEDNMEIWMTYFLSLLVYDNPLLHSSTNEAGLIEQVKSQVCDNISLYAQNYAEDFGDYLQRFVSAVWNLLITTGLEQKYDLLVSNAIQFLTAVAGRPQYKSLFESEDSLKSICEKIIIPNLFLRDVDIEIFEDNPEEYIRKDIERSDADTRRRAASDLVQALLSQFEAQVVTIFNSYVTALLQEYAANPTKNWRQKDVVLYLVTILASRAQTKKHGITKASELIDVVQFYESSVITDLQDPDVNSYPVIKSDAIRYLATFRQQLPREALLSSIQHLVRYLGSNIPVVNTYTAHALERILTVKAPNNKDNMITRADLKPFIEPFLTKMFDLLQPVTGENEYVMKAMMRVCVVVQDDIVPYLGVVLSKLTSLLNAVSKNPSKPHFNHYLFETFGVLIRGVCAADKSHVKGFEENLFPIFTHVITQDITEFIPYSFQLLSLMLELYSNQIPDTYRDLFPFLLMPALWERPGYIPALVRLLQAYIERGSSTVVAEKIHGVLGVFQKLNASKINDHFGFYILNSLIENMPKEIMSNFIKDIFYLLFQRITSSKTTKFVKNMLVFMSLYAYKYSATSLVELVETLQNGMFMMVMDKLFIADLQKVSGNLERKICAVGVTKILTECPMMLSSPVYQKAWGSLLEALVRLFELPEDQTTPEDEHFIDVEDTPGYQTAYSQLASASKPEVDPFGGEIKDARLYLSKSLGLLSSELRSKINIPQVINANLNLDAKNFLQNYLTQASVIL